MSAGTKLNRKADLLIAALLTERTHALAAAKAGISEATAQRWLRNPKFQTAYRKARRAIVETAVAKLQRTAAKAVDVLRRNLTCGIPAIEVRAAALVLDRSMNGVELIDLASRLDELEARLKPEKSASTAWDLDLVETGVKP